MRRKAVFVLISGFCMWGSASAVELKKINIKILHASILCKYLIKTCSLHSGTAYKWKKKIFSENEAHAAYIHMCSIVQKSGYLSVYTSPKCFVILISTNKINIHFIKMCDCLKKKKSETRWLVKKMSSTIFDPNVKRRTFQAENTENFSAK